ncbi:hypothetical protein ACLM44_02860 [Synechococcus sp. W2B2]|uniref:hypothetical protein n=1 Tax=unclassified Synechococcus TaxID=2626047 RepID=UPI00006B0C0A|nr:hypothetical protein [Synechococcus sp. WH 7805]EAR18774.1 hypothetical protein WH7805_03027 [Synechococcus sp. WH 7805]
MNRTATAAVIIALSAPVMAQPVIDPVAAADKTCAAFKDPSMPQSYKDQMRDRIYINMAGDVPAGATDAYRSMWEGYALVRQRGCGQ